MDDSVVRGDAPTALASLPVSTRQARWMHPLCANSHDRASLQMAAVVTASEPVRATVAKPLSRLQRAAEASIRSREQLLRRAKRAVPASSRAPEPPRSSRQTSVDRLRRAPFSQAR